MTLSRLKNSSKLIIPAIFAALFLLASIVTLYFYSTNLSKRGLYAVAGTQENYSWSIAKFAIKLAEFETLVEQQKNAKSPDIDNLRLNFNILYSRYSVLTRPSESTLPLYREPGFPELIEHMRDEINPLDRLVNSSKVDLMRISQAMQHIKPSAIIMANLADHAEVKQRTRAYEDFIQKKQIIFYGLVIIMFSVIALVAITLIVIRQQRQTIRQQSKAIHAEQKAIRTNNAFLGAVGHELRTSLQSIMSAIDVLNNTRVSNEHSDTFHRLETAAEQIESQMKDLTDYARLDSGMMELRIVPFNAQQVIEETADEITMLTQKASVKLIRSVDLSHALIYSDPQRLRQIVSNLLTNAIKYTESGTVTLHCRLQHQLAGCSLNIEVADTGIGIDHALLPQIFEPFTQLDHSNTRQYNGVGMGLTIIHGLVKLLNGTIEVQSKVGEGSTFIVNIPVEVSEEQGSVKNSPPELAPLKKEQKILVVDDNHAAGQAFAALLDKLGYQHELCHSSERALQKLRRRPYDALLLDLQMPGIGGVAMAKQLRNQRGPNRHIPIIGISACTPELLPAQQRAIFDDYLMKPIRMETLSDALIALFSTTD